MNPTFTFWRIATLPYKWDNPVAMKIQGYRRVPLAAALR